MIVLIVASILLSGIQAQGQTRIDIGQNIHLVCNGDVNVVLEDTRFVNRGFLEAAGSTFRFVGSGFANITGPVFTEFHNLEIEKPGATLFLEQDAEINGNLIFQQGLFDLGFYDLYLSGLLVGESENSRITGSLGGELVVEALLNAPQGQNPANVGIEISSNTDLGLTTIRRGHQTPVSGGGGQGIDRYFDISPALNSGLDATLLMHYFDAELGPVPENELEYWRSTDQGQNWSPEGFDTRNPVLNTVALSQIDEFSRWTLGSTTSLPLPLDLLDFYGQAMEEGNKLTWKTSHEVGVSHHELERSEYGMDDWEILELLEPRPSGNYAFLDEDPFMLTYYRLKFVDHNGAFDYSPVIAISREISPAVDWSFFPNPAKDQIFINTTFSGNQKLMILDAVGRVVKVVEETTSPDQEWILDLSDLAAGTYYLLLQNEHLSAKALIRAAD
ncbi:MAG: T9SS type A sorting domain-containing protein [Bacteroidetes bacterium]|nr:T9SS type A sorting domain-containing protein [Bacteroidota bacterium]